LTERTRRVLSGLITILLASSVLVGLVKVTAGATKPVYHVSGTFSSAGQGLLSGNDVKVHGVNIGKVSTIKLVDGQARIRLTINEKEKIPRDAKATIRPKTLFGEKFIDIEPGSKEASGPFLRNGDVIKDTVGGFEVERVLTDLYPVLKKIKPSELGTILSTLARGAEGTGGNVNNSIRNLAVIATAQAGNVKETQQFIDDLALLSDTLADHAEETAQGIHDAHDALPTLNSRASEFTSALSSLATLSGDLADLLENNRPLLHKLATEGGKPLEALDAQKNQLPGVVLGLRQFFQTLAESGTGIPYGGGSLAKVKAILGGNSCQPALADCSGDLPKGFGAAKKGPGVALQPPLQGKQALDQLFTWLVQ
jgi:phospholipid/cholesterol/gamma-HCH transport system substrate-binding protein